MRLFDIFKKKESIEGIDLYRLFQTQVMSYGYVYAYITLHKNTGKLYKVLYNNYGQGERFTIHHSPLAYDYVRKKAGQLLQKEEHSFQKEILSKCTEINETNWETFLPLCSNRHQHRLYCATTKHTFSKIDKYSNTADCICSTCGLKVDFKLDANGSISQEELLEFKNKFNGSIIDF